MVKHSRWRLISGGSLRDGAGVASIVTTDAVHDDVPAGSRYPALSVGQDAARTAADRIPERTGWPIEVEPEAEDKPARIRTSCCACTAPIRCRFPRFRNHLAVNLRMFMNLVVAADSRNKPGAGAGLSHTGTPHAGRQLRPRANADSRAVGSA